MAHPRVMADITKRVRGANVLSTADARLAQNMGLLSVPTVGRTGWNDGLIYPADDMPVLSARRGKLAPTQRVALPKAEAQAVPDDEGKLILTVPETFPKDQIVYLGKSPIPFAELAVKLGANERVKTERELYLHADRNLKYDDVVKVMAVASKAGVEKLGMITDPLSNASGQ